MDPTWVWIGGLLHPMVPSTTKPSEWSKFTRCGKRVDLGYVIVKDPKYDTMPHCSKCLLRALPYTSEAS